MFLAFLVVTSPTLSNSKFLPATNQASDNNPCSWFSPSSSNFIQSLINHKLLLSFTPSPVTHKHTYMLSLYHKALLPSQPLGIPQNCTIVPSFPCPFFSPRVPFSLRSIYDTGLQPFRPPITMTTGGKHLSGQTESRFSQPQFLALGTAAAECVWLWLHSICLSDYVHMFWEQKLYLTPGPPTEMPGPRKGPVHGPSTNLFYSYQHLHSLSLHFTTATIHEMFMFCALIINSI